MSAQFYSRCHESRLPWVQSSALDEISIGQVKLLLCIVGNEGDWMIRHFFNNYELWLHNLYVFLHLVDDYLKL